MENHNNNGAFMLFGGVLSAILSWALNGSMGWAIFHFFCSWIYLIYAAVVRSKEIIPSIKILFGV